MNDSNPSAPAPNDLADVEALIDALHHAAGDQEHRAAANQLRVWIERYKDNAVRDEQNAQCDLMDKFATRIAALESQLAQKSALAESMQAQLSETTAYYINERAASEKLLAESRAEVERLRQRPTMISMADLQSQYDSLIRQGAERIERLEQRLELAKQHNVSWARDYDSIAAKLTAAELQLTAATERARELEKRLEWHSVNESPHPDDDRYVEVFTSFWDGPEISWYSDDCWHDIHGRPSVVEVTHWREIGPLPSEAK